MIKQYFLLLCVFVLFTRVKGDEVDLQGCEKERNGRIIIECFDKNQIKQHNKCIQSVFKINEVEKKTGINIHISFMK